MPVDETLVHSGVSADVSHRHRRRALPGEEEDRGCQEAVARAPERLRWRTCGGAARAQVAGDQRWHGRTCEPHDAFGRRCDRSVEAYAADPTQSGCRHDEVLEGQPAEQQRRCAVGEEAGAAAGTPIAGVAEAQRLRVDAVRSEALGECRRAQVTQAAAHEELHTRPVLPGNRQEVHERIRRCPRHIDGGGDRECETVGNGVDEPVLGSEIASEEGVRAPGIPGHVAQRHPVGAGPGELRPGRVEDRRLARGAPIARQTLCSVHSVHCRQPAMNARVRLLFRPSPPHSSIAVR